MITESCRFWLDALERWAEKAATDQWFTELDHVIWVMGKVFQHCF